MIDIISIYYKNFQSVGNAGIKVDIQRSPTTLLGGQNGAGKSTMLEAISYCLFGKTLKKVKLSGLINTINKKAMLTEIVFRKYGDEYKVVRGEKPKKFEIYKNGELIDQNAAAKDYQAGLERILGMDHKLFTQIVLLNRERYIPFMELSAADRRKVVEDVLDINIFSYMNTIHKDSITVVKHQIDDIEYERGILKTKLEGIEAQIDQAQSNVNEQIDDQKKIIEDSQSSINENKSEIEKLSKQVVDESDKVKELKALNKKKEKFGQFSVKFSDKLNKIKDENKFYQDNDQCPTCNQDIDDSFKQSVIASNDDEKKKVMDAIAKLKDEAKSVIDAINEINDRLEVIDGIKDKISNLERDNSYNQRAIDHALSKIKELESKTVDDKLEEKKNDIEKKIAEHDSNLKLLLELIEEYEIMKNMLKDDGIKATIVDDYVGFINKKMNEYLNAMNFFINITLDGNFNEKINSISKEGFTYENLSTGQKTRVNLAIWLVLLEVSAMKNSAVTNLLFLDEILENLDQDGVSLFMNLIKEKFSHKNVFVVTQRFDEFQDYFRSEIYFKQGEDEFTTIA